MPLASIIFKTNLEQRLVKDLITWIVVPENLCHHHFITFHHIQTVIMVKIHYN